MPKRMLLGSLLVCVLFLGNLSLAQVTTGTILGTVSDATGAVIPGATVTLRNVDTGLSRTQPTDAAGRYRAPQLPLGNYEVTVESAGFQTSVRSGVTLTVGREALVDFALQVGAVAERITVTGEAPLIETTNATVSNVVGEQQMRDLPLNGRSFTDLAVIQPGVVAEIGPGTGNFTGGRRITMNGARPQQSLYLLDGTDIVAPYENVTPSSSLGEFLGVDTVREFSVIQTNAGAQYGRAMGGIVNAVTRSGTNELHGSAFEFLRNDKLQANDFFLNRSGIDKPAFKRNQFGGTVGGPIKKDSTFFFLSYEGLRHREENVTNSTVYTLEARTPDANGNVKITDCANPPVCTQAKIAQTIKVNPGILPILAVSPLPPANPIYQSNGTTQLVGTLHNAGMENYGMVRIDQKLSDSDSLFGRFTIDNSEITQPTVAVLPSGYKRLHEGGYRFSAIEYTRVFSPTILNTVRAAFNRNNATTTDIYNPAEMPKEVFIVPDPKDPTGFARDGNAAIQGGPSLGLGGLNGGHFYFIDNTYILGDTVNWNPGAHSFAIGGVVNRYQMNEDVHPWGWGNPVFANEVNFLTGTLRQMITPLVRGDHTRDWRQTYGSFFVQDDWNVRPGLTLNLGLRWERVTAPTERLGKMAGMVDMLKDATTQKFTDSLFHLNDPLKGLAPRFGFAWTPFGEKTVLRGALGVFKEMLLEYQYQLAIYWPPWAEKFNVAGADTSWPNPVLNVKPGKVTPGEPNIMDRELDYPYNLQWNINMERQISDTLVARAGYVGTRSINLVATYNVNQRIPVKSFDSTVGYERWLTAPCPTCAASLNTPKPNPNIASSRSWSNLGDAYYHSFQTQLEQRFRGGVNYNISYTFSKNLDTIGIGNKCAESVGSQFYVYNLWDMRGEKALSALHTAQNFTASFGYELPLGRGKAFGSNWGTWTNMIAGGWQVNGLITTRTGLPLKVGNNFDRALNGTGFVQDRPDLKAGASTNPVIPDWTVDRYFDTSVYTLQPEGRYGNLARNTLISPGVINTNVSLFKEFSIQEDKNLQFRAEFFNMPNHPNFSSPGTTLFTNAAGNISGTAGKITSLRNAPRQIQLALKFTF